MRQAMLHLKTRPPTTDHCALDRNFVTVACRQAESRTDLNQRVTDKVISFEIVDLLHAERTLQQDRGRDVENVKIAGEEDDAGGVAVTPFNARFAGAGEHG